MAGFYKGPHGDVKFMVHPGNAKFSSVPEKYRLYTISVKVITLHELGNLLENNVNPNDDLTTRRSVESVVKQIVMEENPEFLIEGFTQSKKYLKVAVKKNRSNGK